MGRRPRTRTPQRVGRLTLASGTTSKESGAFPDSLLCLRPPLFARHQLRISLRLHEGKESTNYETSKTDYEFHGLHENAARSDCRSVGFVIRPNRISAFVMRFYSCHDVADVVVLLLCVRIKIITSVFHLQNLRDLHDLSIFQQISQILQIFTIFRVILLVATLWKSAKAIR